MQRDVKRWLRRGLLAVSRPDLLSRRIWYDVRRGAADTASLFGYYKYPHHIIFLAGMAMSATTWMKNLLARIPGYYTRYTPMPRDVAVNENICDSAFKYVPKHGYSLFKTHLAPARGNLECIFRNGVKKVLVMHRDLRDVAIARYHRLMEYPKTPGDPHFIDYRLMKKEEAMDHNIEIVASHFVPWIRGWYKIAEEDPGRYHFVRFEDLKKDTKGEFKKVLSFYDIRLSDDKIEGIVEAARGKGDMRKNIEESKILPWGYSSNFRSGKSGGWRNELTDSQVRKCKELLGPALIELGYEKDLTWQPIQGNAKRLAGMEVES